MSMKYYYFSVVSKQREIFNIIKSQNTKTNRSISTTVEVINTMTGSCMDELIDGWMVESVMAKG